MRESLRICVLGGCGAMGRVIVKCLLKENRAVQVTVADRRVPDFPLSPRTRFQRINLLDHGTLVRRLKEHQVVINSTSHHFNLPVMRASLDAGIHYLDLGGLFHYTRRQLRLDEEFKRKQLTAVLGMGCAPGISNLLASWGAQGLDQVEEIHIKVGSRSWGPATEEIPYAIGTIREELVWKPAIYRQGKWRFETPRSGGEWFSFPAPVGRQKIFRTIHSEIATLPASFPGLREASFKIGFADELIRAVLKGASSQTSRGTTQKSIPRDCEITAALVHGRIGNKRILRLASCTAFSQGNHSAGDWDTAWPPSIVAIMLGSHKIQKPGVFPPEAIVPRNLFFQRLRAVGFKLQLRTISLPKS